jgi:hypothetical protein
MQRVSAQSIPVVVVRRKKAGTKKHNACGDKGQGIKKQPFTTALGEQRKVKKSGAKKAQRTWG